MAKDSGNPETKSMGERVVNALHVWEVHRRCSLLLCGVGAHLYISSCEVRTLCLVDGEHDIWLHSYLYALLCFGIHISKRFDLRSRSEIYFDIES